MSAIIDGRNPPTTEDKVATRSTAAARPARRLRSVRSRWPNFPAGQRIPRPAQMLSSVFLVLLVVAVAHPALFTDVAPNAADPVAALTAPNGAHWLGTDQNGRDILARIIYGARLSLLIGLGASALALVSGAVIGVLAAQGGRFVNAVVDRLLDTFLSVPGLLLVLLLVALLGPGTRNSIIGLAIITTPGYARLVRGEVIRIRTSGFVEAALSLGWSRPQVVLRHIVPNALGPVLVLATIGVGSAIGTGSSLSFLGLGPQPPTPEWGAMLSGSRDYFSVAWWPAVFPGLAITLTVLAVTVVGRSLQLRAEGRSTR
jgi:peptide/nickel transport system permease protein